MAELQLAGYNIRFNRSCPTMSEQLMFCLYDLIHPAGPPTGLPHSPAHVSRKRKSASQTAALVSSCGNGVKRRYGLTTLILGNSFSASGLLTLGCTMTSSPGTQLIGVVTRCLSPVCSESTMRRTSAVLRPVLAG